VLVLAKTEKKFDEIRNDFFQVVKEKYYLAIVKGDFDREGRWEHFFSPYGVKGSKQLVGAIEKKDHSRGVLECLKVQYMKGYSLILVRLKTGLRHQIRAQLAFLGFPILGDTLYGGVEEKRIYLHAWRYKLDGELFQDNEAELFDNFVDLNSAFQVGQDMINRIEGI
jgi:23S rRNA pseudouridine1911/1915/1917 synthase